MGFFLLASSGDGERMSNTSEYNYIGKRIRRIDGPEKVTGRTRFPTDIYFPGILSAGVLRSRYGHAEIVGIDIARAKALAGVKAVLTYQDVPGQNSFGIIIDNWPVLCRDRVCYRGDAIALVAAEDEDIVQQALSLIKVHYKPLPTIDTPDQALQADAGLIHPDGNTLLSLEFFNGNQEDGWMESDLVQEGNYSTQFQEHAFLETEGGAAIYDEKEGMITIWCGSQYVFGDQLQVARSLNWDPEKIRIIGSPCGGAFGGKYEINAQIHLALLAYYTGEPVRLHWSRKESIMVGEKRHPMTSFFRIGVKKTGEFQGIEVDITANAGPYGGISPAVLSVSLESAPGPYKFSSSQLRARAIYTNSAVGGSFRGFGVGQVAFPLEQEIDRLAERLKIDPIELRLCNAVEQGDSSALGYTLLGSVGIKETLRAARDSDLWSRRTEIKSELNSQAAYMKYGIGVASSWHGVGLGKDIPDYAAAEIELKPSGGILLSIGAAEIGQGIATACGQMLAEELGCRIDEIEVIYGDTSRTYDSGPTVSARSVLINGNAIIAAAGSLKIQLIEMAAPLLGVTPSELKYTPGRVVVIADRDTGITVAELIRRSGNDGNPVKVIGKSVMEANHEDYPAGMACYYYTFVTSLALVGVDLGTGAVEVKQFISFPEMGRAINIDGVEGQCEGAMAQGVGYALFEEVVVSDGEFLNRGLSDYIIPTSLDIPDHETVIIEKPDETGPFGAKGLAEAPFCTVAPAIANAIYDAAGIRLTNLPITPEAIVSALKAKKSREQL